MGHYTPKWRKRQVFLEWAWVSLVGVGWVLLVQVGAGGAQGLEKGWATGPAVGVVLEVPGRPWRGRRGPRRRGRWSWGFLGRANWRAGGDYLWRSAPVVLGRTGLLGLLWEWGGERAPGWLVGSAVGWWLLVGMGRVWPGLWGRGGYRGLVWSGKWLYRGSLGSLVGELGPEWGLGACVGGVGRAGPRVEVGEEEGNYRVHLEGSLWLRIGGEDKFRKRLLMLFLRELEGSEERRGSRATRGGRRPLVRQQQIAQWFGVKQPDLSRWEGYWEAGDWRRLLSQRWGEVLTREVQQAVLAGWVRRPGWGPQQVWDYLQGQGVRVTLGQVRQVAEESGWAVLRQELRKRYVLGGEGLRPREEWLVEGLLGQVQQLVERLEAGGGLTREEQVTVGEWVEEAEAVGLRPRREEGSGGLGLGVWSGGPGGEEREEGPVRCTYCGSAQVRRKSRRPRRKRYINASGEECWVEVERWYCLNPDCAKQSFTALPAGLRPYSPWREGVREGAVRAYAWGGSTYRRVGAAAGVKASTVYRWVQEWGAGLLPVAAMFGVVRSSGVVGVDEKYVLVPKNDKREGQRKRWMYVYLAVDEYTYDLLHLAIYPYCTRASAKAFLLALRAKGYHPQVVVTDLREDYGAVIGEVFPQAAHHECIFHFEQAVGRGLREVYGKDYAETHPEAEDLRQEIVEIFRTGSKRTAQRRYAGVLERREALVGEEPGVAAVFDLLEGHWPQLVNAIESGRIPRTNNTVERVIGRFDQYYQNFRGFESIGTAEAFLGVFEKVYRWTPLTEDARPEVRGKCPLELAGYNLAQWPWAAGGRGGPALPPGGSGP